MNHIEDSHQQTFFSYLNIFVKQGLIPEDVRKLTFCVPNGGYRNKVEARRLVKMGVERGIPDILCLAPSRRFHGLAIELKRPIVKGKTKPSVTVYQKSKIKLLNSKGYQATIEYGYKDALRTYMHYLGYDESDYKDWIS